MIYVNEFLGNRGLIDQNPEPSEQVNPFVSDKGVRRDGLTGYAMEAVATRDVITRDLEALGAFAITHGGLCRLDVMKADVCRFIYRACANSVPRVHEVTGHFRLPIDGDGFAGQLFEIDSMPCATEGDFRSLMHKPFSAQPLTRARPFDEVDSALLENAGTDSSEHVILRLLLQNDVVNPRLGEKLTEQKSCRTGSDDDDLSFHSTTQQFRCFDRMELAGSGS